MVFRYGVPQHLKEFLQNLNDVSQVLRQRFSCFKFPTPPHFKGSVTFLYTYGPFVNA